jgi:SAM-dependent methyltransferase
MNGPDFICPQCSQRLEIVEPECRRCPEDGQVYVCEAGIWRLLPEERAAFYQQFMRDYETVRRAEGRGANDPAWYRALPFADHSGCFSEDWRIRARSYATLLDRVIVPLEKARDGALTIADLGAGNGWLSNRLVERGHALTAVDLLVNEFDGLGAHVHYLTKFTPVQAEFDRLPLESDQFDLAVFNGSLHYSTDYTITLSEALRLLKTNGQLVIMDSPVYHETASGQQMVCEREDHFQQAFGLRSDSLPAENFLTYRRLDALAAELRIAWQMITPFYGWRWTVRPLRARLRGHREPARFHVIVGMRL